MPHILVIDDDSAIRAMFARTLRSLGEVEEANGGALALRRLSARKFDLILLDLHMPQVDGFSVLESLASKAGPNHETPIFAVTADESQQARIRASRRHAIFLLTKPVHLVTLLSLAESALKKAAARATTQSDKPAPPDKTKPSDKPAPPDKTKPSDRPAPFDKTKPSDRPVPFDKTKPSDKPAPFDKTKPSDKPAPPDR